MSASERAAPSDDRGVVLVLVAAAMGALVVLVALVLDLGGARRDRDADQVAADAMALSAAASLGGAPRDASEACEAAWDYLVVNLPAAISAPAPSCSAFSTPCVASTARTVTATAGSFRITFTHPVPAGSPLLSGQPANVLDGLPCDRFGVRVQQQRPNLWTAGSVSLDVHAVGRFVRGVGDVQAPLVLLEPTACDVLTVNGSGRLSVTTAAGDPGYIDIDSDGTGCDQAKSIILDVDGNGKVTAGVISMWALGGGDAARAYDATDKNLFDLQNPSVSPMPTPSSAPVGRTGVDWRYNCSAANGCPTSDTADIDQLKAQWGGTGEPLPTGTFTRWTTSGRSCSPGADLVVPAGNWWVDCGSGGISTNKSITFQGGNIVSDGPIRATGAGGIRMNCADVNTSDQIAPATCQNPPPDPSIYVQRSGDLIRNGDLELRETFVYLKSGTVDMAGDVKLTWTAPDDPSHPFDDLLVWTEDARPIELNGTTDLVLEGILFAPNAELRLRGTTSGQALGAQLFVDRLDLGGTANISLSPKVDRMLQVGRGQPLLIR
jgi:hypothetical protein